MKKTTTNNLKADQAIAEMQYLIILSKRAIARTKREIKKSGKATKQQEQFILKQEQYVKGIKVSIQTILYFFIKR